MITFSLLIGQIYDAAIDPQRWPAALKSLAQYAEADRVTLILEDAIDPARSISYLSFSDPVWEAKYLQTYMLVNPMRLLTAGLAKTGDVILTSDFMDHSEYANSRFYREFLSERLIVDVAAAVLEKTATTITVLSLARNKEQGIADDDLRQKLEMLSPHVRRAAAISRILEQRTLEAATLSDTLDQLLSAVFLIGPDGAILHANDSARKLVSQGAIVSEVGGRLLLRDLGSRAALLEALTWAQQGDANLASYGLSIPFTAANDKAWAGVLLPLARGARREAGAAYRATAALCLTEVKYQRPSAVTEMIKLYGLTPREMTVLLTIVENGGIPEVSEILGISEATVRSHIKAVFQKTGTNRQADLVKLVGGLLTPFG